MSTLGSIFASTNLDHIVTQTSRIMNNPVVLFDYNSRLLPAAHRRSRYRPAAGKRLPASPVCQGYAEAGGAKELLHSSTPVLFTADGVNTTHNRLMGMVRLSRRTLATISVLEYNPSPTATSRAASAASCPRRWRAVARAATTPP